MDLRSRLRYLKLWLTPLRYDGCRLTPRRLLNLYRARYETGRLRVRLGSYPVRLTIEPTNRCNLGCPGCFTGVGETGRMRGAMPLELYRRLLDELGDYLFQIEFTNWGEPLLARDILTMFHEASARGISTMTSTNFSLPFDAERAERLVASGLHILGVSIDGATQGAYERYRVRGDLARVIENCRLVAAAKEKLRSPTPRMVWEYHVFAHNVEEIEPARALARDLGMEFAVSKGWVVGTEWDSGTPWESSFGRPLPFPCLFLWQYAVVNNDGGVAPCCGTFYEEDDMGRVGTEPGSPRFRDVWNGPKFQEARRLYHARRRVESTPASICLDCPSTVIWENWKQHEAGGGALETFDPGFTFNDGFNYFWNWRSKRRNSSRRSDAV